MTNETAATKIVELSKKVRELTAELESERTRCKQLQKKCQDAQRQVTHVYSYYIGMNILLYCTTQTNGNTVQVLVFTCPISLSNILLLPNVLQIAV